MMRLASAIAVALAGAVIFALNELYWGRMPVLEFSTYMAVLLFSLLGLGAVLSEKGQLAVFPSEPEGPEPEVVQSDTADRVVLDLDADALGRLSPEDTSAPLTDEQLGEEISRERSHTLTERIIQGIHG
ncbi:hypothetical protein JKP88DRAFT_350421 [Tribonema minus]|uniref:Uncharacterized protein n=1 Tax=Tribonema minus TaxID=303371 RepID=A0A835YMH4_9STRA|nr:hypothetical protein JKP88DRAFT_350421 [Tribonema minus]